MVNISAKIKKQIEKLAGEYRQGIMTHDEVQDVLMGIELSQGISYEELYKAFTKGIQINDKKW